MALNFTAKTGSDHRGNGQTTPAVQRRPQVHLAKPQASTARAEALKARLTGRPAPQPVAPRKAGSSARQQEYSQLQKFQNPSQTPRQTPPIGNSSARQLGEDLSDVAPPPSGLAPGQVPAQIPNSVETKVAPAEATNQPLSPQFVALAKQERQLRKAQQDLKRERESFQQERQNFISKADLNARPIETLTEAGLPYDRLVELQLNQKPQDPNQNLLNKIAELEAKLSGVDEKFVTRDTQAYNAAVKQITRDAQLLVDSDPAYETIKATGQTGEVVRLITSIFHEEGEALSVEEAAQIVEDKLVERETARLQSLMKLGKIKTRLAPPAEPAEATPTVATAPRQKTTTLTNQGGAQRPLSARDRAIRIVEERMRNG
jgi:hypothetical protein